MRVGARAAWNSRVPAGGFRRALQLEEHSKQNCTFHRTHRKQKFCRSNTTWRQSHTLHAPCRKQSGTAHTLNRYHRDGWFLEKHKHQIESKTLHYICHGIIFLMYSIFVMYMYYHPFHRYLQYICMYIHSCLIISLKLLRGSR